MAAATHSRQSMMCLELADAEMDGSFMQFPLPPWLIFYYTTGRHGVLCRPGFMRPDLGHSLGGNIGSEEASVDQVALNGQGDCFCAAGDTQLGQDAAHMGLDR